MTSKSFICSKLLFLILIRLKKLLSDGFRPFENDYFFLSASIIVASSFTYNPNMNTLFNKVS